MAAHTHNQRVYRLYWIHRIEPVTNCDGFTILSIKSNNYELEVANCDLKESVHDEFS